VTYDVPAFVRLEAWSESKKEWVVQHAGINLLHPQRYAERYAANGKVVRAVDIESGKVYKAKTIAAVCEFCQSVECDGGSCLL